MCQVAIKRWNSVVRTEHASKPIIQIESDHRSKWLFGKCTERDSYLAGITLKNEGEREKITAIAGKQLTREERAY